MELRELMGEGPAGVAIADLAYDSRSVTPGALFFCVAGFRVDGHGFAGEAVARGAAALVVQRPLALGVPEVVVDDVRAAMASAAARFFGDPTAELRVVGVTGTNGKTTTAFVVRALLEAAGRQCGLLGTVRSVIGGRELPVVRTTPEAIDLQRDFRQMLGAGDRAAAMEVSSHALELHRVDCVRWTAAIFTNLTQDHLDFHATMEDYFQAKRRLFAASPGAAVINVDDPYGRRLAAELPGAVTFALDHDADWRAGDVRTGLDGSCFRVRHPGGELELRSPLSGRFNVSNVLGALAAGATLGITPAQAADTIAVAGRVPGRFEQVDEGQGFAVLVDYAHTPASLANVLGAARELLDGDQAAAGGRLVCVFGCGGDRDRAKRPRMGEVARRLADAVIVTSDNPRSEDPEAIIADILAGAGAGAEAIVDRRAAIERALALAHAGDVVVIAGKGHERGQELAGGRRVPFDDVAVTRAALRAGAVAR
jgi:UDP-N-acetylmuramoyl-L-alanyl-D-glutamate--2,6-diaminopimelate ligase